jgi:hypothetical protein
MAKTAVHQEVTLAEQSFQIPGGNRAVDRSIRREMDKGNYGSRIGAESTTERGNARIGVSLAMQAVQIVPGRLLRGSSRCCYKYQSQACESDCSDHHKSD